MGCRAYGGRVFISRSRCTVEDETMVRSPRLFISGGIYHVYCRVARGEQVFADHEISDRPALEIIAQSVCQGSPFGLKDLKGRSRTKDLAAVRKDFVLSAVEEHGHAVRDVAAFLEKHPGSVNRWLETTSELSALERKTKEPRNTENPKAADL